MRNCMKTAACCLALTLVFGSLTGCGTQEANESGSVERTEIITQSQTEATTQTTQDLTYGNPTDAIEPTEHVTTAEVTETDPISQIGHYNITIDGQELHFPMHYSDFVACGFTYLGNARDRIPANTYALTDYFHKGQDNFTCYVMNFDTGAHPLSNCYVVGISFDAESITEGNIVLPGELSYNVATKEDLVAILGEGTLETDKEGYDTYAYTEDTYSYLKYHFSKETGTLMGADIKHIIKPAGFVESEIGGIEPDILYTYLSPENLSEDLFAYVVRYDGFLCELPVPAGIFLENGWAIDAERSEDIIPGGSFGDLYLVKGEEMIYAKVRNYSHDPVRIDYCYITELTAGKGAANVDLELSLGIHLGMKEEELEALLLDDIFFSKEELDGQNLYTIPDKDRNQYQYELTTIGGELVTIKVCREPSVNDYREARGLEN